MPWVGLKTGLKKLQGIIPRSSMTSPFFILFSSQRAATKVPAQAGSLFCRKLFDRRKERQASGQ